MSSSNLNVHSAFAQFFSKDELNPWLYQLSKAMEAGNVCLNVLQTFFTEEQEIQLDTAILDDHPLVGNAEDTRPFILFKEKLYLHRFFHYEHRSVDRIKALIALEDEDLQMAKLQPYRDLINELFAGNEQLSTTDWQKVACVNAFLNKFSIISGGPGTGKTTTVTKLLALFLMDQPTAKISICAPTGKAAARIGESIRQAEQHFSGISIDAAIIEKIARLEASTIHSLLGYIPNSIHFRHNDDTPLDVDILIVDECSMIDMALFYKLFLSVDIERTKVILLGDRDQLASVDAGSVFRDLCSDTAPLNTFSAKRTAFLNKFIRNEDQQLSPGNIPPAGAHPLSQHLTELRKSYRFNDEKGIGKLSRAILNNDEHAITDFFKNTDDVVKILPQDALEGCLQNAASLLKVEHGGYIGATNVQEVLNRVNNSTILCAVREGRQGVFAMNDHLSQLLFKPAERFYNYQLIMVSKNQPREAIYNGDMGVVLYNNGMPEVNFKKADNDLIKLNPAQIRSWETAFAMTIHKSQGSEFNEVLIILPDNKENLLLTRELLYTAITRAKKKVTIVGGQDIVLTIAQRTVKRISGIADHF